MISSFTESRFRFRSLSLRDADPWETSGDSGDVLGCRHYWHWAVKVGMTHSPTHKESAHVPQEVHVVKTCYNCLSLESKSILFSPFLFTLSYLKWSDNTNQRKSGHCFDRNMIKYCPPFHKISLEAKQLDIWAFSTTNNSESSEF